MGKNKEFYDNQAKDFSLTRSFIWPEFEGLVKFFEKGDRVLDLGCGNGRFIDLFNQLDKKIDYHGIDNSARLIGLARQKYPKNQFKQTDGLSIPYPDNHFDKILCIAVLHHVPSQQLRQEFLIEANRVLKKDGLLILTTWSIWPQKKYFKTFLKFLLLKISGRSKLDLQDVYISWDKDQKRYIHHFSQNQLKKLLLKTHFTIKDLSFLIRKSGQKNLLAVVKK